ncbi:MAG: hypothetical protein K8R44_02060 [Sulfurimonas sp.]|nr:hypothetical protein [Sulfurimonas sp.]
MNQNGTKYIEEDEIDLRELWKIVMDKKIFIIIFTSVVTVGAIIWAVTRTPIFEVKSNLQIGFIGENLIAEPATLIKTVNLIFNVEEKISSKEEFISEVSSIATNKKLKNLFEIKTQAISNEKALQKNKEVVAYIENEYKGKIDQFILSNSNHVKIIKTKITTLENLEIKNLKQQIKLLKTQKIVEIDEKIKRFKTQDIIKLKREIKLLKTQKIVKIDEKIKRFKTQDIIKLKREIELLKTQKIVKIDEKINFYNKIKINTLSDKIKLHKNKLKEYTKAVRQIYQNDIEDTDQTSSTIASLQIVNYQNLILNSQNKVEDLKIEIEIIKNETILNLQREKKNIQGIIIKDLQPKIDNINKITILNLQREKKNIQNITIKDLQLKIDNINNISIINLQRDKNNLMNDTLRKLIYKLEVELPNKKVKLLQEIEKLDFQASKLNIQNSKVVGKYVIHDYPVKPKKKLIVVVAFVTGLILSIFIVFFLNFFSSNKEDS